MGFTPTEFIWFDGTLVPWQDANVHVLTHGLHYGTGVFEGMRSYATVDGPAIFRLDAHLERFVRSAELYELEIPYSKPALADACLEVVRANRLEASYLRPIAFFGAATLSVWTKECPVHVAVAAFPTGKYLAMSTVHVNLANSKTSWQVSLVDASTGKQSDRMDVGPAEVAIDGVAVAGTTLAVIGADHHLRIASAAKLG